MPRRTDIHRILVIGSGPIVIGQACEFDYSGTQACRVLKAEGLRVILVNSNPATIMTDPEFADATYIEPITAEYVEKVIEAERDSGHPIDAVLATLGGFVGGLVLALMALPTLVIATRSALKAVPPSIREAALAMGASKTQTVFSHVLPLAMPGVMTGAIISMAHALGETAPLLLIGMVSFVPGVPHAIDQPVGALPSLIYIWENASERAFHERTAAAIIVLLVFMIIMNAAAIILRRRFERRW